ncbi:hypothetical protein TSUD_205240 [Trifolium subterraneum]|uniref:Uncharacterized protein n=1 Tax=Trifolium subterraneum TaxID=3900 RepID=A0A2Z6MZQ2_TRISU|nr:hypothetical protein TSUD_205240 [Trifolium subterraneum]
MSTSQLQWYRAGLEGPPNCRTSPNFECVHSTSTGVDLISNLITGKTSLDRLMSVVEWSISTTSPQRFGVAPYNPILGETHHVSKGDLNVLLEQVGS